MLTTFQCVTLEGWVDVLYWVSPPLAQLLPRYKTTFDLLSKVSSWLKYLVADAGRTRPGFPVDILHLPRMCLPPKNQPFRFHFHLKSSFSFPFSLLISYLLFCPIPAAASMPAPIPVQWCFSKISIHLHPPNLPGNIASSPPLPFLGNNLHPHHHLFDQSELSICLHLNPSAVINPSLFLCNNTLPSHPFGSDMHLPLKPPHHPGGLGGFFCDEPDPGRPLRRVL